MDPMLTVIIPANNEEQNIDPLYHKLKQVLIDLNQPYEIFFIDDGSTDMTFQNMKLIQQQDRSVKIIKFRKNFGKSTALNVAFHYAIGQIIITMDADLQDDPEEIPKFIAKLDEGFDLVSGWKYLRFDPITKTIPSKFFNKLTCLLTGVNLHDFNCGFKAYRISVIKNLQLYGEMHRYIPALAAWNGFKIAEIKVIHHPRHSGTSKYGFSRIIKGLLDLITVIFLTRYASRPLHVFGIPGILSFLIGIVIGLYLVMLKYLENAQLSERPLLMLSVLLIVIGFQFFLMGLLGEMIAFRDIQDQKIGKYIENRIGEF